MSTPRLPCEPEKLKAFIDDHGLSCRVSGNSFVFVCYACGKEKLAIRRSDGYFSCWSCKEENGTSGAPEWALSKLAGVTVGAVRRALYGWVPDRRSEGAPVVDWGEIKDDRDVFYAYSPPVKIDMPPEAISISDPLAEKGRLYLRGRNLDVNKAASLGCCYWPQKRSLVWPIVMGGVNCGWQTRKIYKPEPWQDELGKWHKPAKSITSEGCDRTRAVMFLDTLVPHKPFIVAEGPISAMQASYAAPAGATLGKTIVPGQLWEILRREPSVIYWGLDPDALTESRRILRDVRIPVMILRPYPGRDDLGECSENEMRAAYAAAREFEWGEPLV